jgi:membrane associated rhomboid family serine protease
MFAFVILGSLVETWMAPLSRKRHVVIFGLSYLVSFLFVLVAWIAFGSEPGIGASGMVFAILGFVVYYYYAFPNLLQLQGRRRHAPLLIGIVLAPLIISLFTFVPASHIGFQLQVAVTLYTFAIHWICFIFAFFAARVVYQKWRLPRPLPLSP